MLALERADASDGVAGMVGTFAALGARHLVAMWDEGTRAQEGRRQRKRGAPQSGRLPK